jgi:preprotein translocase subunit YajC
MQLAAAVVSWVVAQGDGGQAPGPMAGALNFVFPVLMFAVIYLLLIRPAQKQRKEQAAMLSALKKDDEVVTSGGIVGRIVAIDDKIATLEVADKVKIRVLRDRLAGRYSAQAPQGAPKA